MRRLEGFTSQPCEWFTLNNPYYKTYAPERTGKYLARDQGSQVGSSGTFSRPDDIPDLPACAFRDARGCVQLIASHYSNRRMSGPNLDHLTRDCGGISCRAFV